MPDKEELEFWLKTRGLYPFLTYRGGAMKAIINLEIPLDEIAARYGVETLKVGDIMLARKGKLYARLD